MARFLFYWPSSMEIRTNASANGADGETVSKQRFGLRTKSRRSKDIKISKMGKRVSKQILCDYHFLALITKMVGRTISDWWSNP